MLSQIGFKSFDPGTLLSCILLKIISRKYYEIETSQKGLPVTINVDLKQLSISVDCRSHLIVTHSQLLIICVNYQF